MKKKVAINGKEIEPLDPFFMSKYDEILKQMAEGTKVRTVALMFQRANKKIVKYPLVEVEFTSDTDETGMIFTTDYFEQRILVKEFSRGPDGRILSAESHGEIQIGHALASINGISAVGLSLTEVQQQLKLHTLPWTFFFMDPG